MPQGANPWYDSRRRYACWTQIDTPISNTDLPLVAGTSEGHGYAEDINNQANVTDIEFAQAYYRAARFYNSGEIDASNDLGKGGATHCYASDIANRLTGWVDAPTKCTLDQTNSTTSQ